MKRHSDSSLKEGAILSYISKAKSKGLAPGDIAAQQHQTSNLDEKDQLMLAIYEEYEVALKKSNSLDFDDLLIYGVKLFEQKPNLGHWCKHILVDEF